MSSDISALLSDALKLPAGDRAKLVARLIDSLEPIADADCEAAWVEEIKKRIAQIDGGEVTCIDWSEARRIIAGE